MDNKGDRKGARECGKSINAMVKKGVLVFNSDNAPEFGQIFPSTAIVCLDLFLYLVREERPAEQVR